MEEKPSCHVPRGVTPIFCRVEMIVISFRVSLKRFLDHQIHKQKVFEFDIFGA